ncbi:DUF6795 domain-containing protein [Sandarakinorhabdus sp.]|uniref:DUF6795 domain-containing protein n=1 Tax=Sandarakinorhabdus sp. TaxID=1916663 RepID=UPI00286E617C|nr:DUF6795 domain-containing protein [Sandarakinorhabdus sp.]
MRGGEPIAGAELQRQWTWPWGKEVAGDTAKTDSEGRFHFPAVLRSSFMGSILPHSPSIQQKIRIAGEAPENDIWQAEKNNYRPGGELGPNLSAPAIAVVCDLAAAPALHGGVYGVCKVSAKDGRR